MRNLTNAIISLFCFSFVILAQEKKLNWEGENSTQGNTQVQQIVPNNNQVKIQQPQMHGNLNPNAPTQANQSKAEASNPSHNIGSFEQYEMSKAKTKYVVDSNMNAFLNSKHVGNGKISFSFILKPSPKKKGWRLLIKALEGKRIILTNHVDMDNDANVVKERMILIEEQQPRDDYFLEVKENDDMLLGKNKLLKIRKTVGLDVTENEPMVSLDEKITTLFQIIQWIGTVKSVPADGITIRWIAASKPMLVRVTDISNENNTIFAINKIEYTENNETKPVSIQFVFPKKHNSFSFPDKIVISMGGKELSLIKD